MDASPIILTILMVIECLNAILLYNVPVACLVDWIAGTRLIFIVLLIGIIIAVFAAALAVYLIGYSRA
jgi:hypothetical protein